MNLTSLLEENDLELDDVRWYRAEQVADDLRTLSENRSELVHSIWAGRIESKLRTLDEAFIESVDNEVSRGLRDETDIYKLVNEILSSKQRRNREY